MNTSKLPDTLRPLRSIVGIPAPVSRLAWSHPGDRIATAMLDGTVLIFDVKTRKPIKMLRGHYSAVTDLSWSPDDTMIATASFDKTVRVWNSRTGRCNTVFSSHTDTVFSVDWSEDGKKLVSASQDCTVRVWNLLQRDGSVEDRLAEAANVARWLPSSPGYFVCGGAGNSVDILGPRRLRSRRYFPGEVYDIACSRNGMLVAVCGRWPTISIPHTKDESNVVLEGHFDEVTGVSFSGDGLFLASRSLDDTVRVWRTDNWQSVLTIEADHSQYSRAGLAFHPIYPILATFDVKQHAIKLWRLSSNALLKSLNSQSIHYTNAKVVLLGDQGWENLGCG